MEQETRTLIGKVRYARERAPERNKNDAEAITIRVWQTFYSEKFRLDPSNLGVHISDVFEAIKLPSIREVRSAMKRIDKQDANFTTKDVRMPYADA